MGDMCITVQIGAQYYAFMHLISSSTFVVYRAVAVLPLGYEQLVTVAQQ